MGFYDFDSVCTILLLEYSAFSFRHVVQQTSLAKLRHCTRTFSKALAEEIITLVNNAMISWRPVVTD
jgi:hypothetical protein